MKRLALLISTFLFSQISSAAFINLSCEAYRISQDSNENIQKLTLDRGNLTVNELTLSNDQRIDGSLFSVYPGYPASATYQNDKGTLNAKITYQSRIEEFTGALDIGRSHDIEFFKAEVKVSSQRKTHTFTGVCKAEVITTCGGACEDENQDRDTL